MAFIAALDQGTTSSRCILFDQEGKVAAVGQKEFTQHFPQAGWVEHDAGEIWSSQMATVSEALARVGASAKDVAAIGITNQRETTVVWDRATGEPIHRAIVWQDRRTAGFCDQVRAAGHADLLREKTGLELDAYFSGSKLRWILDAVPGAHGRAAAGELAFGTVDTWLVWKLTGGAAHVTDPSNASRTMLFDIRSGDWDDELLRIFGVPRAVLPVVRSSSEVYGTTIGTLPLAGVPIAGIAGDQQAALFGQMCLDVGMTKNTYGTGCFMLRNTGTKPAVSRNRLLTTVAWRVAGETEYALEGSVFIGGAVVQWLRDGLGLIRESSEIQTLAASVKDNGGIYLVPAFAGLGAPHWDPYARGLIVGITRGTTAGHFARAAQEAIAYQVADLLDAMTADTGSALPELRVDGGGSRDDLLMQIQADIAGVPVVRSAVGETTALGAAYLAGLAVGYWKDARSLAGRWRADRRFEPEIPRSEAMALRERWNDAVGRSKGWERAGS